MEMRMLNCSFKDPDGVKITLTQFLGRRTMKELFTGIAIVFYALPI